MAGKIRVGVIGLGSMGKRHLEAIQQIHEMELTAVCTRSLEKLAAYSGGAVHLACSDYRELAGHVDAVIIALPAELHFESAFFFLEQGTHVFVEKPVATAVQEAKALADLAVRRSLCLFAGHIERFNPAFLGFQQLLEQQGRPSCTWLDAHRLGSFQIRVTATDVVRDLMIHDLDLACAVAGEQTPQVEAAVGTSVRSSGIDLAMAKLRFPSGMAAQASACRVADQRQRGFVACVGDLEVYADLLNQALFTRPISSSSISGDSSGRWVPVPLRETEPPLIAQQKAFARCIMDGTGATISTGPAVRALVVCEQVLSRIADLRHVTADPG